MTKSFVVVCISAAPRAGEMDGGSGFCSAVHMFVWCFPLPYMCELGGGENLRDGDAISSPAKDGFRASHDIRAQEWIQEGCGQAARQI